MTSTFHSLETAKRSLFTQTTALSTTGHNIANANTAGYSRQVVNMKATPAFETPGLRNWVNAGQLGSGVEASAIVRVRDSYLDDQFRGENAGIGSWTVRQETLSKLEAIVNEPSNTGLSAVMNNFWSAWSDFSKDPQDITNRKIIKETTLAMTDSLNQTSKQLDAMTTDLTANINLKATEVNSLLKSIADLNAGIKKVEDMGNNANDLSDQRDYAVDQLSKIANVTVTKLDTGYQVTLGGTVAVAGTTVTPVTEASLKAAYDGGGLNKGELYGMFVSRDDYVVDYRKQLDTLADTMANGAFQVTIPAGSVLPEGTTLSVINADGTQTNTTFSNAANNRTLNTPINVKVNGINGLMKMGYTIDGATPSAGVELFSAGGSGGAITAGNITLNPQIQNNPNLIASSFRVTNAGTTGEKVVTGNAGIALIMADMKSTRFDFGSAASTPVTIDDYFSSITGQLGVQSKEAARQAQNATDLADQVESLRQSVSGVSMDEEMTNLVKFQQAYNASARFMTTFDEMLDKLINGTGTVGR
ncbi:flagellar hook-associated protein FlgK [Saccharibacillus alkalitolerans]|uniref:Flagellar hook-associated protein 1 n=1 Tax=Saccharibacillus alkalitolerans TaxID=2705290 RepID=A0ABX0F896_9BACL|nr:flagellar hook-associated protein FlgK [Saccharibacillus alkalitolerans]NGZ76125.1 flagellar hook-associated protein FlgK [Saccharibacillus alkalitolerans]